MCVCVCVCPSLHTDANVWTHTWAIQTETARGHRRAGCPALTENRLCTVSTWSKLFTFTALGVCVCVCVFVFQ